MLSVIISGALVALAGVPAVLGLLHLAKKRQEESLQTARVLADKRRRYYN